MDCSFVKIQKAIKTESTALSFNWNNPWCSPMAIIKKMIEENDKRLTSWEDVN